MTFTGRPQTFDDATVANDGFFPSFTLGDFNAGARVDTSINAQLVQIALENAMAETNTDLQTLKTQGLAGGFLTLRETPLAGAESLYLRAVFCRAKAVLVKEFATLTRKKEAENTAREGEETHGFYIQAAEKALRLLRAETGSAVCVLV